MGYGYKQTSSNATSMEVINILQEILLEAGWTKTSDTGQWDGVSEITSADEYVMWAMPTDGGTLDPVVLKIHPATPSFPTYPTFNLAIGNATDGAGTITGTTWTAPITVTGSSDWLNLVVYYAYDDGGVVICGNKEGDISEFFILIERKRTPSGAPVNGAIGTMFFQGQGERHYPPNTANQVKNSFLGVSVFNTNNFTKPWGTQTVSSPIADNPVLPKSSDGLTAPSQPVMFFGHNACWYSNLILVVLPSEGGTAMQAVVNGSPRYYRTVQPNVLSPGWPYSSSRPWQAYPISGSGDNGNSNYIKMIMPAILNQ